MVGGGGGGGNRTKIVKFNRVQINCSIRILLIHRYIFLKRWHQ